MESIFNLRKEYKLRALHLHEVAENPIDQFHAWFSDAIATGITEPNAMTLATVSADHKPSARIVLLKEYNASGFTFFTNYESRKGQQLEETSNAAILFFWQELERQVRIEGIVEKISETESDQYFLTRPFGSRVGAITSQQSSEIIDRNELEKRFELNQQKFQNKEIARPSNWGGYRLKPILLEFWQGRPNRLHDRIEYSVKEGVWTKRILCP